MKKTLPLAAAVFAVAAIAVSAAPRASECRENGVVVACPPEAKLSFQQQAAAPLGVQPPQELDANQFRPAELDPQRYPGPSLTSDDGGDNGE